MVGDASVRTIGHDAGTRSRSPPSPVRCSVAKGQVKVSKNNKPKLTVKEKFAKTAATKAAKMK